MLVATEGQVAQLVEHSAENRGVAGSIPALPIDPRKIDGSRLPSEWGSQPMARIIVRVEITDDALTEVQRTCDRKGMTQVTVFSRLVEWFFKQDDVTKAAILTPVPGVDAARLVADNLALHIPKTGPATR
jgi:hypothetical protein